MKRRGEMSKRQKKDGIKEKIKVKAERRSGGRKRKRREKELDKG